MASALLKHLAANPSELKSNEQSLIAANDAPQVDLEFTVSPIGHSYLSKQIGKYPYHIGRLIKNTSTPPQMAMLFLQCTSGGLFEHDQINMRLTANAHSMAAVKHASASVVHSMQHGQANTQLHLVAQEGAYIEYTGNLNILFPNSHLNNQLQVELHPNAMVLIADAYLIHDPTQQSTYFKQLETTISVYNHQQQLLVKDRFVLSGSALAQQLHAVSAQFDTHATLYILSQNGSSEANAQLLTQVNATIAQMHFNKQTAYIGAGHLPKQCGAFVRIMCRSGQPVQQLVTAVSNQLRNYLMKQSSNVASLSTPF